MFCVCCYKYSQNIIFVKCFVCTLESDSRIVVTPGLTNRIHVNMSRRCRVLFLHTWIPGSVPGMTKTSNTNHYFAVDNVFCKRLKLNHGKGLNYRGVFCRCAAETRMFYRDGKGEIMNRFYGVFHAVNFARAVFALCAIVACGFVQSAHADLLPGSGSECLRAEEAAALTVCGTFPCYCSTGDTGTEYSCPSGWSYSSLSGECERLSVSGSDAKGSYTDYYDTCEPSTSEYPCFELSGTDTGDCICKTC